MWNKHMLHRETYIQDIILWIYWLQLKTYIFFIYHTEKGDIKGWLGHEFQIYGFLCAMVGDLDSSVMALWYEALSITMTLGLSSRRRSKDCSVHFFMIIATFAVFSYKTLSRNGTKNLKSNLNWWILISNNFQYQN